jgi:hypothetical protein
MNNKTQKKGGGIQKSNGLYHILSIGYEIECSNLMKLTKTEIGENVLFNSDTLAHDAAEIKEMIESMNYDDVDDDLLARSEELVEMDVLDKYGDIDKNASFSITNDISPDPFTNKLGKYCYYLEPYENDDTNQEHREEKNKLYMFRDTERNIDYKINFLFKTFRDCEEHSNVEWIFTYFYPERSANLIMDTFSNVIRNLTEHLSDLIPIHGNFIMNDPYTEKDAYANELIIEPEDRILYHKPNTNLYYLQNHVVNHPFTIDDVCTRIQTTFSMKIENLYTVLKAIFTDNRNAIPELSAKNKKYFEIIQNVKQCVDEMVKKYNESSANVHKLQKSSGFIIDSVDIDVVKNYLFLFLYKIERYFEFSIPGHKTKYLKNKLVINSRHSNYILYVELKNAIKRIFEVDDKTAIDIIKSIVLQPKLLTNLVSDSAKEHLRKGVFLMSNTLDKTHKQYGNPVFSMNSYFDFFEDPVEAGNNDWLEYKEFDSLTARIELNDDVVLIELRSFQDILSNYAYGIADSKLKDEMENGACNKIRNQYSPDISSITIGQLKKMIDLLTRSKPKTKARTMKPKTKTKGKTMKSKSK